MMSPILRWRYFQLTDLTDFLVVCHYSPSIVHYLAMFFLWIYSLMHRTDFFIVSGADLEYTKNVSNHYSKKVSNTIK